MSTKPDMPKVEVAVAVIMRGPQILTVYNPSWGAFTLPMTKRRAGEAWRDAAIRAESEAIKQTTTDQPEQIMEFGGFEQSDRDGVWKRYTFQIYKATLGEGPDPADGQTAEWLSPEQIADETRKPISPTARRLLAELKHEQPDLFA